MPPNTGRAFPNFFAVQTRWSDANAYRHVNNARYYALFDSVIMHFPSVAGGFNVIGGEALPFTVENLCRFHKSLAFPDIVDCGLRVTGLGNSSVRYEIGLLRGPGIRDRASLHDAVPADAFGQSEQPSTQSRRCADGVRALGLQALQALLRGIDPFACRASRRRPRHPGNFDRDLTRYTTLHTTHQPARQEEVPWAQAL